MQPSTTSSASSASFPASSARPPSTVSPNSCARKVPANAPSTPPSQAFTPSCSPTSPSTQTILLHQTQATHPTLLLHLHHLTPLALPASSFQTSKPVLSSGSGPNASLQANSPSSKAKQVSAPPCSPSPWLPAFLAAAPCRMELQS